MEDNIRIEEVEEVEVVELVEVVEVVEEQVIDAPINYKYNIMNKTCVYIYGFNINY